MKTRTKRGRPKKPEGQAKTLALPSIRVAPDEMSFIEAQAAKAGLPVSTYIRNLALHKRVAPARSVADDRILFELNRCGVNLHQVVKSLNFGQSIPTDITSIMDELRSAIANVSASYDP